MQLKENAILQSGKYRIIRVLGQGGFGITYLAKHSILEKQVAIKEFFPKDFCERESDNTNVTLGNTNTKELVAKLKEKFLKEAKNISKLNHPNIVAIHDIFEENGTAYYIMDYIEGISLNDKIKQDGALLEMEALELIKIIGSAIGYMHGKSMNHLDIKPANIMLRAADNAPILIDFGLSKQYDSSGEQTSTTPVGISHGYAPIEQYKPGGVSTFTPQTDVYALGATLYALLTGNTPPHYTDILEDGFPEISSSISHTTEAAIETAMETKKNNRPASVAEFIALLSLSSEPEPISLPTDIFDKKDISTNEKDVVIIVDDSVEMSQNDIESETEKNISDTKDDATQILSKANFENQNSKQPPVINVFKTSKNTGEIYAGDEIFVLWEVTGAESITVNGEQIRFDSGSKLVKVPHEGDTAIVLTACNSAGTVKKTININVQSKNSPIIRYFKASKESNISVGESFTISWEVDNCDSVSIDGIGEVPHKGTRTLTFHNSGLYPYTLYASKGSETVSKFLQIVVKEQSNQDADIPDIQDINDNDSGRSFGLSPFIAVITIVLIIMIIVLIIIMLLIS